MAWRAAWLIIACSSFASAQATDVIRGRVLDRQQHALADVEVIVTAESATAIPSARTDKNGRYVIAVREPQNVYVLSFRHVGFASLSRIVRRSGLASTIDVEDVTLTARLDVLEPIVTRSAVLVPSRGDRPAFGAVQLDATGSGEFTVDPSDVASLIALLPGVRAAGDSGYSVLGAAPTQNRTMIDGADFSGGQVPRDAIQRSKLVTNTFDPSQGRFAGGEAVVTTRQGSPSFEGTLRSQLLHPSLTWADPQSTVSVPLLASLSGYAAGPLRSDALTYLAAVDLSRRSADASSLLAPRPRALSALGVSPDTVAAVTDALRGLGTRLIDAGALRSTEFRGSVLARTDFRKSATTTLTLSSIANWHSAPRAGVGALSFPSTAKDWDDGSIRVLFNGGTYIAHAYDEFRVSAASAVRRTTPISPMPTGIVQVGASFDDGRSGSTSFQFGGSGSDEVRLQDDVLNVSHETSWVVGAGQHQLKLTQEAVLERQRTSDGSNVFGTYTFSNLDDLLSNHPAAYSRSLSSNHEVARAFGLGASLGDVWRAVPGRLDLQAGVRVDATRFGVHPPFNASTDSVFGLRTDGVPFDIGISPRLGFLWRPRGTSAAPLVPPGTTILGSRSSAGHSSPIDAAGVAIPPDADEITITGGVGAFRAIIPLQRVAALVHATGLPSTQRSLACVGDATPTPDWSPDGRSLPAACLGGASVFGDDAPDVSVLSSGFRAPVSWRGNVAIDGLRIAGWGVAPQLTYAIGRNVESVIDRNLSAAPAFTLAEESDRPVFVPATAIDHATGLIGPAAGRIVPTVGRVRETLSDLEYHAAQLTIGGAPRKPLPGGGRVFLVYSWTPQHVLQRGFDGTTAGDPRTMQWVTGAQPVHQIIAGAANLGTSWLRVGTRISASSGLGFTPMIAQDVNGDRLSNDRAFVPNPATSTDTILADQLRSLLATSTASVRGCLGRQLGTIAAANSCRTGWRARIDLAVNAAPPGGFGFGGRWRVTATILNAGTALVRLFHLDNTPLGRGSDFTVIDQRLLYVTGFDNAARQFRYRVNQSFGEPITFLGAQRLPPFELQVGVHVRLGPLPSAASLPPSTVSSSSDDAATRIRNDLISRFVGPDPVIDVLEHGDSLGLDADQREGIRGVDRSYIARRDSILSPVAALVLARGKNLTSEELRSRMQVLSRPLLDLGARSRQHALSFLTSEQRQRLDALLRPPARRQQ